MSKLVHLYSLFIDRSIDLSAGEHYDLVGHAWVLVDAYIGPSTALATNGDLPNDIGCQRGCRATAKLSRSD